MARAEPGSISGKCGANHFLFPTDALRKFGHFTQVIKLLQSHGLESCLPFSCTVELHHAPGLIVGSNEQWSLGLRQVWWMPAYTDTIVLLD